MNRRDLFKAMVGAGMVSAAPWEETAAQVDLLTGQPAPLDVEPQFHPVKHNVTAEVKLRMGDSTLWFTAIVSEVMSETQPQYIEVATLGDPNIRKLETLGQPEVTLRMTPISSIEEFHP